MSGREATLGQVMLMLDAKPLGFVDEGTKLRGTCAIDNYQPGCVGFVRTAKYRRFLESLHGAVVLIPEKMQVLAARYPQNTYLVVDDVSVALLELQDFFYRERHVPTANGIAPMAVVASSAQIGADVHVGDYAFIGPGASIGDRTKNMHSIRFTPG